MPVSTDDVVVGPVSSSNTSLTYDATAGTNSVNSLLVNSTTVNTVSFIQTGGNLTAATTEIIGSTGTGTFTQSGGTNTVSSFLSLGFNSGGNGTYNLSGTGGLSAQHHEFVGFSATGTFNQNGGTNTVAGNLYLGYSTNVANGIYNLSAGILSAVYEIVGSAGNGTFNQSGGMNTTAGLYLGNISSGNGTYNLNGGTLNVSNNIFNTAGTGTLNIDGGTFNFGGTSIGVDNFNVGNASGSNGSFTLAVGQNLTATNMNIAAGGTGSVTQNGVLTVTNGITNSLNGTFNVGAGAVATVGGTGFMNHGLLKGKGTIAGNVTSDGTVGPGNSPGKLTINGNYSQLASGVLNMEIGGLLAGTEYDVLNISGAANLAGTLNVSLFDLGSGLFNPNAGDTFDILTAESITGTFDILSFANLINPGLFWHIDYLTDAIGTTDVVRLSVVASAVPIPAAVWLFGSGLLGLIGMAKRRTRK